MKTPKLIKSEKSKLNNTFTLNDDESLEFEKMVINSDAMKVIRQLMKDNNEMTRTELANKLGVTNAYLSKLFSSDKFFNVALLAKIQRVFNMKINIVTSDMIKQYKTQGINIKEINPENGSSYSINGDGIIKLIPQIVSGENAQINRQINNGYSLAK